MKTPPSFVGCGKVDLPTPALCLDLDKFDSNVQQMVDTCRQHNVQWRPHAKCHKSPVIGRWLVDAGACGLTCATIREAETMAAAGIGDLLIANMIAGPVKIERLVHLASRSDVMVCVDHSAQADAISSAVSAAGRNVRVLVELEIGMQRVGVDPSGAAIDLARRVDDLPGLEFAGLMAYEGHLLTIADVMEKRHAISAALTTVTRLREQLEEQGVPCPIVSCGGTGSFPITVAQPGITEIQAGGAIFMDAFYRDLCGIDGLEHALTILTTVGSIPAKHRAIIDAGRKAMNIEIHTPQVVGMKGVTVDSLSAEHGALALTADAPTLHIGQQIELIPGYADLTNVLHRCFYGFRNGRIERRFALSTNGSHVSRMVLGTAQIGLDYGVANQHGRPSDAECERLLSHAIERDVRHWDTARSYGDAERRIGAFLAKGVGKPEVQIVSKLAPPPEDLPHERIFDWVQSEIDDSRRGLGIDCLEGWLVHDVDAVHKYGDALWDAMLAQVDRTATKRIGLSVYDLDELRMAVNRQQPIAVQLPLNLLDHRFPGSP